MSIDADEDRLRDTFNWLQDKIAERDLEVLRLQQRLKAYERNMMLRDKFLVQRGIYQEFMDFALCQEPDPNQLELPV